MIADEIFTKQMNAAKQAMYGKVYIQYPAEVQNLLLKLYTHIEFMTDEDAAFINNSLSKVKTVLKK